MHDGSVAGHTTIYATMEEARNFYAAMNWLNVFLTMGAKTEEHKGLLEQCIDLLDGKVKEIRAQPAGDEVTVSLLRHEVELLSEAEILIDQFAMAKEFPDTRKVYPKKNGAKKK